MLPLDRGALHVHFEQRWRPWGRGDSSAGVKKPFLKEVNVREQTVTLPELALLAGTRVVLGAGLGLLFAGRLNDDQRRAAGWALFGVGALITIPLAFDMLGNRESLPRNEAG